MGPLLFTCYVNDLPDYLDYCEVTLYADDTVLFISDKSLHNIKSYMNSDLEELNKWLKLNHLTLSISKSKFMIIGSSQRQHKIDSISFQVDNMVLDEVTMPRPRVVRVFLCPCVGPFTSVGLTLTWFIWGRNLALHITL